MRLLALQHSPGEPPAAFEKHAAAAGDEMVVIRLFDGEAIPDLADFDALLTMGGPMDIWEIETHPWLVPEKTAIKEWLATGKPYLGICLGHQLLVEVAGGTCTKMAVPEIAVSDVRLSGAMDDPLLGGLPDTFPAMHWHGVEAMTLPPGATLLGSSDGCAVQAVRMGNAWGLQFHPELEPGTITQWMQDPANLACATDWLGSEMAAWDFVAASEARADDFMARSAAIYAGLRGLV